MRRMQIRTEGVTAPVSRIMIASWVSGISAKLKLSCRLKCRSATHSISSFA